MKKMQQVAQFLARDVIFTGWIILKYTDHYKIKTTMMLHLLELYSKGTTKRLQS